MGILDDVLGSVLGGRGNAMQNNRGGGLGGALGGGMQTGSTQGGMSPIMMALMALLSQQTSGGGGGLGGLLGGLTGQPSSEDMGQMGGSGRSPSFEHANPTSRDDEFTRSEDRRSGHAGGMGGLLERMAQNGHGSKANSWVGHGQNEPISSHELNDALGPDTIDQLSRQTGMSKDELLSQLSQVLPDAVDKLTPEGRMPERHEMQNW